jgi:predicted amidohydrolase
MCDVGKHLGDDNVRLRAASQGEFCSLTWVVPVRIGMSLIRVALLQMTAGGSDQDANRSKGEAFCREARELEADIALFPEMWNTGYAPCPPDEKGRNEWQAQAIGPEDDFIAHFKELAAELNLAIALTYLERWDGPPRNSVTLIDRHGKTIMTYAKVHTCDFSMEAACTPGDDFYVGTLDADKGPVKVGAMICFDREFPESARILMLKGAELILTPNGCTLDDGRIGQFRARAFENMVGVAMANYAEPQSNGCSVAFDAVSFDEANDEARDTLIVEADGREGVYVAQFDMDKIRAYRERESWGNAFRKPRSYGLLTSLNVEPPFIRRSARR